jgi:hypothetical protein
MRTSGTGRDGWMTIIPILVLVFFGVVMVGGPRETLVFIERSLEAFVNWVSKLAS